MNKAYIFCNNNYKNFNLDIKLDGLIIAADGGANYLQRQDLKPDVIIGDMDSINSKARSEFVNTKIIEYSADKDFSDTELAIRYCLQNNLSDITIINSVDGALSHTLANLFIIENYLDKGKFRLYNKNSDVYFIKNEIVVKTEIDDKISLIPISKSVFVEKTDGLKFALHNENLGRASSRGISNRAKRDKIFVKIKSGILLLIRQL